MRLRPTSSDGPGDRMSVPSIAWISPAFTAVIRSQPARPATDAASTGLPHHDARMISASDQVADDVLLEVGEREHQIGLERQNLVEPERGEAPDARLLAHGLGPARRAGNADHPVAGAHEVGDLRGVGGETDDPLRELG